MKVSMGMVLMMKVSVGSRVGRCARGHFKQGWRDGGHKRVGVMDEGKGGEEK